MTTQVQRRLNFPVRKTRSQSVSVALVKGTCEKGAYLTRSCRRFAEKDSELKLSALPTRRNSCPKVDDPLIKINGNLDIEDVKGLSTPVFTSPPTGNFETDTFLSTPPNSPLMIPIKMKERSRVSLPVAGPKSPRRAKKNCENIKPGRNNQLTILQMFQTKAQEESRLSLPVQSPNNRKSENFDLSCSTLLKSPEIVSMKGKEEHNLPSSVPVLLSPIRTKLENFDLSSSTPLKSSEIVLMKGETECNLPAQVPWSPSKREPVCGTPPKSPKTDQMKMIEGHNLQFSLPVPQSPSKRKSETVEPGCSTAPKSPCKSTKSPGSFHCKTSDFDHSFHRVKQSLHTAKPEHLLGRNKEVSEIKHFLQTHLLEHLPGSMYISGAPGTGKTVTLLHVINDLKVHFTCQIAYLNCMTVNDSTSIFPKLYSELSGKKQNGHKVTLKDMEKFVVTTKGSLILVLDEIDQLDSRNQDVLYHIFEWPSLVNSKVILIGVANALDLTNRILPRLTAKPSCHPKLLHFAPYSQDQIIAIISDRLGHDDTIIENSAVQFCARKVSAVTGDMRKALDVCRRAVELVESEGRTNHVLKVSDCNSPSKSRAPLTRKVGVSHIFKVMAEVYGSSVQTQQSDGVPLQQKLVVCTLLLTVKSGKSKEVYLGKLYENYCKLCCRQQMTPVDQSEFHSLCTLLEARGIFGLRKARETRLVKLTLRQDQKELEQLLQDKILVSTILSEGLPK